MKNRQPDYEYLLIDGNWGLKPKGFCRYHKGWVTQKIMDIHGCMKKRQGQGCVQFLDKDNVPDKWKGLEQEE